MNVVASLISRYIKTGGLGRVVALLPLLGKMGFRQFAAGARDVIRYIRSGKATKKELAILIAAIVYFLSPVDFIPDFIPVAGMADDLVIATLVATYLHKRAMASMREKGPLSPSAAR